MRHSAFLGAVLLLAASPALADPVCSKLAWPLDKERALLNGTVDAFASGETRKAMPSRAISLMLKPGSEAGLPVASAKPADPAKFGGYVIVPVVAAGDYLVSLSAEGWIDALQDGATLNSTAHTGDADCPGLRKSVRFTLAAKPLTLEISNAPADHIEIAITPAPAK
ncbi:MAG TPA: hypothetical protein VNU97_19830 [Rhizomicrobium sp.]|jgi:hypothetical protein|nr:hypothetical protein [Rhizomicrobium sp.]